MRKQIVLLACLVSVFASAQITIGSAQPMEIAGAHLCGPLTPCAATLSTFSANAAPSFTLRKEVGEVRLQFTVTDKQGRHVAALTRNDVALSDNGIAVSNLTDFHEESDLPIQVVILIDSSRSTERELPSEKQLALEFLQKLLRPQDRAMIASFSTHLTSHGSFTNHFNELAQSVSDIKAEGLTALNDSLFKLADAFDSSATARKVVIVVSDGNDTVSAHTFSDAREQLLKKDVAVYSISINDKKALAPAACLNQISAETGGHSYILKDLRNLKRAFDQIDSDLRTYYVAAYRASDQRQGFHAVDIHVAASNASVQTKKGYFR